MKSQNVFILFIVGIFSIKSVDVYWFKMMGLVILDIRGVCIKNNFSMIVWLFDHFIIVAVFPSQSLIVVSNGRNLHEFKVNLNDILHIFTLDEVSLLPEFK